MNGLQVSVRIACNLVQYVIALLLMASTAIAQDIYVDVNANGTNDGTTWPNAFNDLQDALDEAQSQIGPEEIWVAAGTYTPSVQVDLNNSGGSDARRKTFNIPPGLTLLGGFNGTETLASQANPASNVTILSGDLGKSGNAFHVLVIEHILPDNYVTTTVIDGFTITGGKANGVLENATGGGAWLREPNGSGGSGGGGPVFRRCVFEDNYAQSTGGAIVGYRIGITLRDCTFRENEVNGSTFAVGAFTGGGAVSAFGKLVVANCRFESNACLAGHAGALIHGSENVEGSVISNCEFLANSAAFAGGGAVLPDSGQTVIAHITNCLFAGNVSTVGPGGGLVAGGARLHHCTFVHNDAPNGPGGGCRMTSAQFAVVDNCVFWANTDEGSSGHGAQLSFSGSVVCPKNCIIQGFDCGSCANCGSLNNVDADPEFYDIDGADNVAATVLDNLYELRAESPGVDSGDNALIPDDYGDVDDDSNFGEDVPLELNSLDRLLFTTVDRGAFEFTCLGDIVSGETFMPPPDGVIDGADLGVVLNQWSGNSPPPACGNDCWGDIVDSATFLPPPDGVVDGADLGVILINWGDPCVREQHPGGEESLAGPTNPFEGTEIGDLLEQFLEEEDDEARAELAAALLELLSE